MKAHQFHIETQKISIWNVLHYASRRELRETLRRALALLLPIPYSLPSPVKVGLTILQLPGILSTLKNICRNTSENCLQLTSLGQLWVQCKLSEGEFVPRRSWAVTLDDAEWREVPFRLQETDATVEIETELLRVSIQRQNCRMTCFDKVGRPFAQDADMSMGWRMGAVAAWKQIEGTNLPPWN